MFRCLLRDKQLAQCVCERTAELSRRNPFISEAQLYLSTLQSDTSLLSLKYTKYASYHIMQKRHKNLYHKFGHKKKKDSMVFRFYSVFLLTGIIVPLFFSDEIMKLLKLDAASLPKLAEQEEENEKDKPMEESEDAEKEEKKKKKKAGFRDRKIMEYENRIRQYSTPDKVFRYFATLKVQQESGDYEVYMTPDDFVRSITPGVKQTEGLGLDQFKKFDPKKDQMVFEVEPDSVFFKLGECGLISFSDYIFLLTLLSTPEKQFALAFKMFDFNGDGDVDYEEFQKVQGIIRSQTSVGQRHRDHQSNTLKAANSALSKFFFGDKHDKTLTIDTFLTFQSDLHHEILKIEFNNYQPEDGRITERDFADILIIHAGLSDIKRRKMMKRIKEKFKGAEGITFKDFMDFFTLLNHINDIDTALTFYTVAGASIDQLTLKHVAKTVTEIDIRDHVLNVVFTLFDDNDDGQLSNKEFISVMKQRAMRGLEKSKDTGFFKLLNAVLKCGKQAVADSIHSSGDENN